MRKSIVAVAVAGAAICIAGVAAPAVAHPSVKIAKATVTPSKNVKPGKTVTVRAKLPLKNSGYYCILASVNKKHPTQLVDYAAGVKVANTNSAGRLVCKQTYKPFSGKYKGKTYSCPPTKATAKKGWSCAVFLADQGTQGKKSLGIGYFTAKK